MYKCVFMTLVVLCGLVHGFEFDGGQIKIPQGFEGPTSRELMKGVTSTGFVFSHGDNTAAVLQITIWKSPEDFSKVPKNKLEAVTQKYLMHFLQGISNNRTKFVQEEIEWIQIANHKVARLKWSGLKEGHGTHGIMYCLIYNGNVYSFHAQDFSEYKNKYTDMAVKAIESVEFKNQ